MVTVKEGKAPICIGNDTVQVSSGTVQPHILPRSALSHIDTDMVIPAGSDRVLKPYVLLA